MAIYEVYYEVSNSYAVHVEADSPEDARRVVETIYQENYDALPEDGELDHSIELGILIDEKLLKYVDPEQVRTIDDAFPNGKPPYYNEEDYV